jgi:uncharacterized membrane protein YdjX (TVP38/TMEM64 family)
MHTGRRIRTFLLRNSFLIGPLVLIAVLISAAVIGREYITDFLLLFENVVAKYGVLGQVFFVGMLILATLSGVIPLSLFALLGGVAYGLGQGFLLSFLGIMLGAAGAFLLGRYAFRSSVDRWVSKRVALSKLDQEILSIITNSGVE